MIDPGADAATGARASGAGKSGPLLDRRVVLAAVVIVLALVAAVGYVAGADMTERRHDLGGWHTAVAHVGTNTLSIEYDDWVYGASGAVEVWIDERGTWHDSGWPRCLRVPPGSRVLVRDLPVRFAAHEVTVDDQTWRPIIAIDCRANPS